MNSKLPKFMQTLEPDIYKHLQVLAEKRGIKIQELIRAVIIPEWLQTQTETIKT